MQLDLPIAYLDRIRKLLRLHVPTSEVWAFGSRVTGFDAHERAELEMVLRNKDLRMPTRGLQALEVAIIESQFPISIKIHDWASVQENLRVLIVRQHVVLQIGKT